MSEIEKGSGNVFADLGLPNAGEHLVKARLVSNMLDIMHDQGLTQTKAAALMGVTQPEISKISRGNFGQVSTDKLLTMLTRLGAEVDIVVQPRGRTAFAPIHLDAAAAVVNSI